MLPVSTPPRWRVLSSRLVLSYAVVVLRPATTVGARLPFIYGHGSKLTLVLMARFATTAYMARFSSHCLASPLYGPYSSKIRYRFTRCEYGFDRLMRACCDWHTLRTRRTPQASSTCHTCRASCARGALSASGSLLYHGARRFAQSACHSPEYYPMRMWHTASDALATFGAPVRSLR